MINRDNKKAITKKGMISNRLNKFSIRKYTVGTASILVGTTLIFGLGNQEAKAAENTSTENAKQDDATTSDNKEVVSKIIRQQKIIQQIQLRKKQILIHNQKLKKNQLHQVLKNSKITLQLQLKLSLKTLKKKMLNLQLIKLRQKIHLLF